MAISSTTNTPDIRMELNLLSPIPHLTNTNQQIRQSTTSSVEITSQHKPAGVFSPKLSRILPQKVAVSPSPAWLKKFEPTVTQNPMTIRRFFIIVIEKYRSKEFKEMRTD
ncbi:hypothetical protein AVEN_158605-1 [Araneus ventricosus]|uniref:Uncharacterized protein n=1 Tax=Araneus ventricosus TaxID=182803 RepID=A0A4Y2JKA7_ARAVE|nr:hypothetical protein AVEN_158605-1 [Araneus ventricosus]